MKRFHILTGVFLQYSILSLNFQEFLLYAVNNQFHTLICLDFYKVTPLCFLQSGDMVESGLRGNDTGPESLKPTVAMDNKIKLFRSIFRVPENPSGR